MADKILCPWCGAEMRMNVYNDCAFTGGRMLGEAWRAFYRCHLCGAQGPEESRSDGNKAEEAARAAALRRYMPRLKPMTLEEVDEHVRSNDANPLWIEDKTGYPSDEWILAATVWQMCKIMRNREEYGKTWRCWSRKPTDEERSEAEWET